MSKYSTYSLKLLGRFIEPYRESLYDFKDDLQAANLDYSVEEYAASGLMSSIIALFGSFLFFSFFGGLLLDSILTAFFLAILMSVVMTLGTVTYFYFYPSLTASKRRKNIDAALPFATTYMSTIADSGAPPVTVFKLISNFEEYGEFTKEVQRIVRDVEVFGYDLPEALKKAAQRTPSDELRELFWGIISTILSGGDLGSYLRSKSKTFLSSHKRSLDEFSKQMSLYIEIYLTLIIVGSIFFIVLTTIMSAISVSGSIVTLQFLVIFILLPVISTGFIYLLKQVSPLQRVGQ